MVSMIKRDLYMSVPAFITAFFFVLISYAINMSPLFITISVVILLVLNLFYYDFHNSVYNFIVSLPVSRKKIVLARYIVTACITVFFIGFIWVFDAFAHSYIYPSFSGVFGDLDFEPLSPILILFICLAIVAILSVSIPIYYYALSIAKAVTIQIIFFLGIVAGFILSMFSSLFERLILSFLDIISAIPSLSIIAFITISLIVSYALSVRFFSRRDLA